MRLLPEKIRDVSPFAEGSISIERFNICVCNLQGQKDLQLKITLIFLMYVRFE